MRLRPPSPGLVVACLALAISLSGTAYAVSAEQRRHPSAEKQLSQLGEGEELLTACG